MSISTMENSLLQSISRSKSAVGRWFPPPTNSNSLDKKHHYDEGKVRSTSNTTPSDELQENESDKNDIQTEQLEVELEYENEEKQETPNELSAAEQELEILENQWKEKLNDAGLNQECKAWIFEVCWEIGNKVGGIWTVLSTKAAVTVEEYGDKYVVVGFYRSASQQTDEIQAFEFHEASPLKKAVDQVRSLGFNVLCGRWSVPGKPLAVLLDIDSARDRVLDACRPVLERDHNITVPQCDFEASDCIIFGYLAAELIWQFQKALTESVSETQKIVAHFHEWLSAIGLLFIKIWELPVATVFTTHSTLLGRYLSSDGVLVHRYVKTIKDPHQEAENRGILHRHRIEFVATQWADVFTTVSNVTAKETKYLLHRRPDVITQNGLHIESPTEEEAHQSKVASNRNKIEEFLWTHFYGHVFFERDNTLVMFSAGRYEYRNKGVDLIIESLIRLNHLLSNTDITVYFFFIYPTKTFDLNAETLRRVFDVGRLKREMKKVAEASGESFNDVDHPWLDGEPIPAGLEETFLYARQLSLPPVTTHNILFWESDLITYHLRRAELLNSKHDRVKVIFYPRFLTEDGPLLGMTYNDFVRASDLGVFPSLYESWGGTPAECIYQGTPTVTTNLAGFGRYTIDVARHASENGVHVIDREKKTEEEQIQELTDTMYRFTQMSREERQMQRERAKRLAKTLLDWRKVSWQYQTARKMALDRIN